MTNEHDEPQADESRHDEPPADEAWYWDLKRAVAVPASERGPADQVLGPYPTRAAAEHWRERVDARNEAWDDDDERWRGEGDERRTPSSDH